MSLYNIVAATSENTVVAEYEPIRKRSDGYQSEAELEQEFIRMLTEQGYAYLPMHTEADLIANLRAKLEQLNGIAFSDAEWKRLFEGVIASKNSGIEEKTSIIQENPVQSLRRDDGSIKNIKLIDRDNIHSNRLQVINQYEVSKDDGATRNNRYDVTILV
ncbi:MAG: type I restriction endonuclease subunit R, partial [Solobacterium sp.]|nr:type I restriction endonuclease subunit R [Solobacterium sp.]